MILHTICPPLNMSNFRRPGEAVGLTKRDTWVGKLTSIGSSFARVSCAQHCVDCQHLRDWNNPFTLILRWYRRSNHTGPSWLHWVLYVYIQLLHHWESSTLILRSLYGSSTLANFRAYPPTALWRPLDCSWAIKKRRFHILVSLTVRLYLYCI